MLFNSFPFLFCFLPLTWLIFWLLIRYASAGAARTWLLLGSLFFYGYWNINFLGLLLCSICANFCLGLVISKAKSLQIQRWILMGGLLLNLVTLFYWKYALFFAGVFNAYTSLEISLGEIILPLGISFYTFTQIAYLVDIYRKKAEASDFTSYALFVTVFPHLISGPVLHHKEMLKQFHDPQTWTWRNDFIAKGLFLFVIGLAKKILLADSFATQVDLIFDHSTHAIGFFDAWYAALAYSLQLYFDFSGYSDMAVGLGLMFNLHLPINFNSPYQASSIIDFWRRWHISLSVFLKNYLYIPLGGSRNGEWAKMRNLFITIVLGGMWHGAGWTFLTWGACHGVFLIINHQWNRFGFPLPKWFGLGLTLFVVIAARVFFRSPDMGIATNIFAGMFGMHEIIMPQFNLQSTLWMASLWVLVLKAPNSNYWAERFQLKRRYAILAAIIAALCVLNLSEPTTFIYYQF